MSDLLRNRLIEKQQRKDESAQGWSADCAVVERSALNPIDTGVAVDPGFGMISRMVDLTQRNHTLDPCFCKCSVRIHRAVPRIGIPNPAVAIEVQNQAVCRRFQSNRAL